MTPITPQCEVFWTLLSSSEHSGVPEDSKPPTFPSVGLHPPTLGQSGVVTLDLKKEEEERKKLPLITLAEEGIPTELAYTGAKNTIRHIISTNFARGVEWGTLSKAEQKRVINQVKGAFRNGGEFDSQWIADKISNSMSQARYHDKMKIHVHLRDLNVYRNLERPL